MLFIMSCDTFDDLIVSEKPGDHTELMMIFRGWLRSKPLVLEGEVLV